MERTEAVFRKMEEIEKWLQDIEEQSPKEDECKITDSAELYQMKARFQTLKDKCDDKTTEFRNLNEAGKYYANIFTGDGYLVELCFCVVSAFIL